MDFGLSEDQLQFKESIHKFLSQQCDVEKVRKVYEQDRALSDGIWRGLCELGVPALTVAEEYGGYGRELLDLAVLFEEIGYHAAPGPIFEHILATYAIQLSTDTTLKNRYLPRLASGEKRATVAFCETGDRWLPEDWLLQAETGVVTGDKLFVPYALESDLIIVGLEGGRLGVVEMEQSQMTVTPLDAFDRTRSIDKVFFECAEIELLGGAISEKVRDVALILLAADSYGGACRCVELAAEYSKIRQQFGTEIANFQGLKHQIANMALEAEPPIGLYWYAAHMFDTAAENTAIAAANAKAHIGDRYVDVSRAMIEAHGGIGYTWEYEAHYWMKRAVFNQSFMGDAVRHRRRVADLAGW